MTDKLPEMTEEERQKFLISVSETLKNVIEQIKEASGVDLGFSIRISIEDDVLYTGNVCPVCTYEQMGRWIESNKVKHFRDDKDDDKTVH